MLNNSSPLVDLLRSRSHAILMFVGLVAKLPASMLALALVLLVGERWDLGAAGWTAAALALGLAVTGPLRGRAVDRYGPRFALSLLGLAHGMTLLVLALAIRLDTSLAAVLALAWVSGATSPPIMPVLRACWMRADLTDEKHHAAQAWESVSVDIAFVAAPLLVALTVSTQGRSQLLLLVAGILVLTVPALALMVGRGWAHAQRPATPNNARQLSLLTVPEVRRMIFVSGLTAIAISAAELGAVHVADALNSPALAGVLIAILSATSILGGLAYAHQRPPGAPHGHLRVAAAVWAVGLGAAALLSDTPAGTGIGLGFAGLGLAVLMTSQYQIAGSTVAEHHHVEVFAWMATASQVGLAVGAGIAGHIDGTYAFLLSLFAAALLGACGPTRESSWSSGSSARPREG